MLQDAVRGHNKLSAIWHPFDVWIDLKVEFRARSGAIPRKKRSNEQDTPAIPTASQNKRPRIEQKDISAPPLAEILNEILPLQENFEDTMKVKPLTVDLTGDDAQDAQNERPPLEAFTPPPSARPTPAVAAQPQPPPANTEPRPFASVTPAPRPSPSLTPAASESAASATRLLSKTQSARMVAFRTQHFWMSVAYTLARRDSRLLRRRAQSRSRAQQ